MNRRSTPGLGQWFSVTVIVVVAVLLLYKLFQYGSFRSALPAGLTVAGIDVGGQSMEMAREILSERYLNAPVTIYHGNNAIQVFPEDADFQLDLEAVTSAADFQRSQQDFWSGFWGFLWGRPVEVEPVELHATHSPAELESALNLIASRLDTPTQPPQAVPSTLSFRYGEPGVRTNVRASLDDAAIAFYRPTGREAHLTLERVEPERPEINLLARLIVNHLQTFEQTYGGSSSVFILDLASGDEIGINGDLPMSGMNVMKLPIVLETYRLLDGPPSPEITQLISTAMTDMGTASANALLAFISGEDDPVLGAQSVTETVRRLGLANTFIIAPYEAEDVGPAPETPANTRADLPTRPDPAMQTTAEDMGTLMAMIYYCAQGNGGAVAAALQGDVTQAECQALVDVMRANSIGSLIEEGVPPSTDVAHLQGWIGDTHGDVGVVFTEGGDYVLAEFLYKPDWLEWELSSPLLADVSRAAYNFFNFETPFLESARSN